MALWHVGDNYASDIVVFAERDGVTQLLLIRRKHAPFQDYWALPGGFVNSLTPAGHAFVFAETHVQAAVRELQEETGIIADAADFRLIGTYDAPGRDPRAAAGQRVVTQAFLYQASTIPNLQAGDDAADAQWIALDTVLAGQLPLAFDHHAMIYQAWIMSDEQRLLAQQQTFMRRAITLGQQGAHVGDGGPFGAVVVKNGQIVGEGWNQVLALNDPTAHAEVMAIRQACQQLARVHLSGCELYSAGEPCSMCLSASYWAHIDRIFYGFSVADAATAGFDDVMIYEQMTKPMSERRIPQTPLLSSLALSTLLEYTADNEQPGY